METRKKNKKLIISMAIVCACVLVTGAVLTGVLLNRDSAAYNAGYTDAKLPTIGMNSNVGAVINSDGRLYTWGSNATIGGRGDGVSTSYVPTSIAPGYADKKWKSISCGYTHTIGIDEDGYMYTWGHPQKGQLGNGDMYGYYSTPTPLHSTVSDKKWKMAVAGYYFSAAIDEDGYIYTWGSNDTGQLGDGTTISRSIPGVLEPNSRNIKWKSVSIDGYVGLTSFVVALTEQGKMYTWGKSSSGGLGSGEIYESHIPQMICPDKTWTAISVGSDYALAIDDQGAIYSWGQAVFGKLGHGKTDLSYYDEMMGEWVEYRALVNLNVPTPLVSDKKWKAICAGYGHSLAIDEDGYVYGWGYLFNGRLGTGWTNTSVENWDEDSPHQYAPAMLAAPYNEIKYSEVMAGYSNSIVKAENGDIYTFGNRGSMLGIGDVSTDVFVPVKLTMPAPVINCPCCRP